MNHTLLWIHLIYLVLPPASQASPVNIQDQRDADPGKLKPVYVLYVESEPDSESTAIDRLHGKRTRDHILILINDNPILFFSWGSTFKQINHYLKPGRNMISVKGNLSKAIWLEIGLNERIKENGSMQQKQTAALLDEIVEPDAQKSEWRKDFEVDITYTLPIYDKENLLPKDRSCSKEQVLAFLKKLHGHLGQHETEELRKIGLESGSAVWRKTAYGETEEEYAQLMNSVLEFNRQTEYPAFDANSINLIFGPNVVMAYSGFVEEGLNSAYIWPLYYNNEESYSPPHILACINEKWVIWE